MASDEKTEEKEYLFRDTCPYCNQPYKLNLKMKLKSSGLTTSLIKPHDTCGHFLIFIDTKGKIRGIQTIDSKTSPEEPEKASMEKYIKLFEDIESQAILYHILPLSKEVNIPKTGILTSRLVKYHNFLRSPFYQDWIRKFLEDKEEFRFMFFDEIIVSTINMYDTILLTLGLAINDFDHELHLNNIIDFITYIKGKVVNIGEKIISLQ
jgi:hypothetical protein